MIGASDLGVPQRLAGISCTLRPGELTAICGPNGAGKSTLLHCLAGLLKPATGQVTLDGADLFAMPAVQRARAIGYLPQTGEIAWNLSVEALAGLGRLPHGDTGSTQVTAALEAVGMGGLARRPVATLSGGERARALLARVLAGEPRWILADEPLAALDLAHQLALLAHFRWQTAGGAGVVLVLHDLALAMNHADRVIVLDRGSLAADGPPQQALSEAVIARVWQVRAQWSGAAGRRALSIAGPQT